MEKSRRSMWKLTKQSSNLAITQFFSYALDNGQRLFVVKPHSGKTHQIRVALKSIGSAICGDPLYAEKSQHSTTFDRAYLHAYQIDFRLNDQDYSFNILPQFGALFTNEVFTEQLRHIGGVEALAWPKI